MRKLSRFLIVLCIVLSFVFVVPSPAVLQLPTVTNVEAATKVKLSRSSVKLVKKQNYRLKITGTKKKIKWSSNSTSVATVSDTGLVKPVGGGNAVITAKVGGKKYKCKVTVVGATYVFKNTIPYDPKYKAWHFLMNIDNPMSQKLKVKGLTIYDIKSGRVVDTIKLKLRDIGMSGATIDANGSLFWNDNHPKTKAFNARSYRWTFEAADGTTITMSYLFKLTDKVKVPYNANTNDPSEYKQYESLELDNKMNSWHFFIHLENPLSQPIEIKNVKIRDLVNNWVMIDSAYSPKRLRMKTTRLEAKDGFIWQDNHPYTDEFNGREYIFECVADDGTKLKLTYVYKLTADSRGKNDQYDDDPGRDLETLRYNAKFKVKIANGVYWVPARTLGESSYVNSEISKLVSKTPEEKQANIDTLYEALQLYQIGNFLDANDNVRIRENGIDWEHHKPGYYSVLSNCGCCASDSSWLSYILRDDYEEIGYMQISQPDGGGHVINYIKSGDWYYLIDLTHYRTNFVATAIESGQLNDFYNSDKILGNILAVQDLKDYAEYFVSTANDPPGLIIQERMKDVPAIDGVHKGSKVTLTYGSDQKDKLTVIYDNPDDQLFLGFATPPTKLPDWAALCR